MTSTTTSTEANLLAQLKTEIAELTVKYDESYRALAAVRSAVGEDSRAFKTLARQAQYDQADLQQATKHVRFIETTSWPTRQQLHDAMLRLHQSKDWVSVEGGRLSMTRYTYPKRSRPLVVIEMRGPHRLLGFNKELREMVLDVATSEELGGSNPAFEEGVESWNGGDGHTSMTVVLNKPHTWPTAGGMDAPE